MRAYIAAPWDNKPEAARIREHLATMDIGCTATWIDIDLEAGYFAARPEEESVRDFDEVAWADLFFMYVPDPDTSRGGRDVELGLALALGKLIVLIGTRRCVFHFHPDVRHFPGLPEWIAATSIEKEKV